MIADKETTCKPKKNSTKDFVLFNTVRCGDSDEILQRNSNSYRSPDRTDSAV